MSGTTPLGLSVVVPIYNKPDNIAPTIETLAQNITIPYEILAVYGFDEDTTLPVLRRLERVHPQLRLVKNKVPRGPSGALRAGFAEAGAPRGLVTMADLCDDLTQVPLLMQLSKEGAKDRRSVALLPGRSTAVKGIPQGQGAAHRRLAHSRRRRSSHP